MEQARFAFLSTHPAAVARGNLTFWTWAFLKIQRFSRVGPNSNPTGSKWRAWVALSFVTSNVFPKINFQDNMFKNQIHEFSGWNDHLDLIGHGTTLVNLKIDSNAAQKCNQSAQCLPSRHFRAPANCAICLSCLQKHVQSQQQLHSKHKEAFVSKWHVNPNTCNMCSSKLFKLFSLFFKWINPRDVLFSLQLVFEDVLFTLKWNAPFSSLCSSADMASPHQLHPWGLMFT